MPHHAPIDTTKATAPFAMTLAEGRVMARIFQHPMSHNLSWRETVALFDNFGAVEHAHNVDLVLVLGGEHQTFNPAHHTDLTPDDIMSLRHFLARAGWAEAKVAPQDHPQVVVLDRAEARIYPIPNAGRTRAALATDHLTHQIDPTQHDANRDQNYPADIAFFASIAKALGPAGGVVLISHGKGQSNESAHFITYLDRHNLPLRGRIMANLTADLSHITMAQCLDLARAALADNATIAVI